MIRPTARRLGGLIAVAALGAAAGALALQIAGSVGGDAGPGAVRLEAKFDTTPRTELLFPPLGSISAPTHRAPVTASVRLERVDVAQLEELVTDRRAEARLRDEIAADLAPLARSLFLRCVAVAALAGAVVGAVLPRRRWTSVLAGSAGGMVSVASLLWWTGAGFDETAFEEPHFEGPVSEAPRIMAAVGEYVDDFDDVRGRIDVLSAQIRDLYATSLTNRLAAGPGRRRILHVSDIHLNPVGLEVARQLADQFDVDAVLDTGDITSFGHPLEGQLGQLVEDLPVPYYLVPGNHDSPANRAALGRFANLTVLDGQVVEVAGVRVLGVGHPSFTADNRASQQEVEGEVRAQAKQTGRLVMELKPDVLAVHDPAQAADALGDVPTVVSGHVHRRGWEEIDGSVVLTVGTTGATGLGAFTVDASLAYEASVLYFDGGDLVAVDNVALRGTAGEFRIDRRLAPPRQNRGLGRGVRQHARCGSEIGPCR